MAHANIYGYDEPFARSVPIRRDRDVHSPRRKSFQEPINRSLTHLDASFSSTLGARRPSWTNLVESEENLSKNVSEHPDGQMMFVTPQVPERPLKAGHGLGSGSSSLSEFVVLPSSSKGSIDHVIVETRDPRAIIRRDLRPPQVGSFRCPCSCRKILIYAIVALGVILFAAVLGVLIRRNSSLPNIFRYELVDVGERSAYMTVAIQVDRVVFDIHESSDFEHATATGLFGPMYMIFEDTYYEKYCFVMHLNETAFPNGDAIRVAANNALELVHSADVGNDWHWRAETVTYHLRSNFVNAYQECAEKRILWIQRDFSRTHDKSECPRCSFVCLPRMGTRLIQLGSSDKPVPVLQYLARDCFWVEIPETQPVS